MMREHRLLIPTWAAALATLMLTTVVMMAFCDDADAQRRRRRTRGPLRDGAYARVAFGVPGSCIEGTTFCNDDPESSLGNIAIDGAIGLRFAKILGAELRGFANPFTVDGQEGLFGGGFLSLKLFPVTRGELDPYIAVGAGFIAAERGLPGGDSLSLDGGATHIGAGVDYYLSRQIALGLGADRYFVFPVDAQGEPLDDEGFWSARLNLTIYFGPFQTTSSSKPKRRPSRPARPSQPRPKPRPKKELH